jgi:hypothetical protein
MYQDALALRRLTAGREGVDVEDVSEINGLFRDAKASAHELMAQSDKYLM